MKDHDDKQFFESIFCGNIEKVESFLNCGIDANILDLDERTPLIHATIDGNVELVKLLLERGAYINIKDFQKMTPLHFSAQNYDIEMCKCLVDAGSEIDAQDDNGNTPLWRAEFESNGKTQLQDFLIKHGANENLKNHHAVSPKDLKEG